MRKLTEAVAELNTRFLQHDFGYAFVGFPASLSGLIRNIRTLKWWNRPPLNSAYWAGTDH
jgi:hypothetical protein